MSRFDSLLLDSEEPFATGAATYLDSFPGIREGQPRIYVKFRPTKVDPGMSFLALLDTGGHFCILGQDLLELIQHDLTESVQDVSLHTARGLVRGELYHHRIVLIAEKGETLEVETNLLVVPDWQGPSILGYSGFMDRLCVAIDSGSNRLYFGSAL